MILVFFLERIEGIVRIISTRPPTHQEIKDYEENAQSGSTEGSWITHKEHLPSQTQVLSRASM